MRKPGTLHKNTLLINTLWKIIFGLYWTKFCPIELSGWKKLQRSSEFSSAAGAHLHSKTQFSLPKEMSRLWGLLTDITLQTSNFKIMACPLVFQCKILFWSRFVFFNILIWACTWIQRHNFHSQKKCQGPEVCWLVSRILDLFIFLQFWSIFIPQPF